MPPKKKIIVILTRRELEIIDDALRLKKVGNSRELCAKIRALLEKY